MGRMRSTNAVLNTGGAGCGNNAVAVVGRAVGGEGTRSQNRWGGGARQLEPGFARAHGRKWRCGGGAVAAASVIRNC